tara:strand:+ start:4019 stop:4426 length:408 start_codon:yes stop_codon:yes gene_type:complete
MSEKFEVDIIKKDFLGFVKTHYVSAEIFIKILEEANNEKPLPYKQLVHDKWLSTYTDMKYIGFDNVNDLECRLIQAVNGNTFIGVKDFTNLLLDYVFDKLADRGLMDFDEDFTILNYILKSDVRKSTFQNKMLIR